MGPSICTGGWWLDQAETRKKLPLDLAAGTSQRSMNRCSPEGAAGLREQGSGACRSADRAARHPIHMWLY